MKKFRIESDFRKLNLLIVEDGEDIIEIMDRTFKMIVNSISLAKDGKEAYEHYLKNKPDIILTDLRMPNMSGNELVKKIRENDNLTPIIVITAYEDDLEETQKQKVQAIVNKPINFINLIQTIDDCVLKN